MARFYFNVFNDSTTIDDAGLELPDLAAAKDEARNTAADVIREEIAAGRPLHRQHYIEVLDANRQVVHVLRFGDLVAD